MSSKQIINSLNLEVRLDVVEVIENYRKEGDKFIRYNAELYLGEFCIYDVWYKDVYYWSVKNEVKSDHLLAYESFMEHILDRFSKLMRGFDI